jgi:hypothetical protein
MKSRCETRLRKAVLWESYARANSASIEYQKINNIVTPKASLLALIFFVMLIGHVALKTRSTSVYKVTALITVSQKILNGNFISALSAF